MPRSTDSARLLADGEEALAAGDSERAYEILARLANAGVGTELLPRVAAAFARAGRTQSCHDDVLSWIERAMEGPHGPVERAALLRAQVAVCRLLDLERVPALVEEALAAADEVGDEQACADVLMHAAFAAYRRGETQAANDFAGRAADREFSSPVARYAAARAQLFAATAGGELERMLELIRRARALAREAGGAVEEATEATNLAECYLALGFPAEAGAAAREALELCRGHREIEAIARVLGALATAEIGQLDEALEKLGDVELTRNNIIAIDTRAAHAYWLLERSAAGDAVRAREIAVRAIEGAERHGVHHQMTSLYSGLARALERQGREAEAREALAEARRASARAEPISQSFLALAYAEILPVEDPQRRVALSSARARILRYAENREDPRAFCINIRVHRRLLELSGGVPQDLPPHG